MAKLGDMIGRGATGSKPAAGTAGRLYYDTTLSQLQRDTGAAWEQVEAPAAAGFAIGARVYNTGDIAVADSTPVTLTFDTERYDTDTIHSTVANTGRLTATTAGKYIIVGNVLWDSNDVDGSRQLVIRKDATDVIARCREDSNAADYKSQIITTIYDLSATNYVTLEAYQNSGSSINIKNDGKCSPEFMMSRIG